MQICDICMPQAAPSPPKLACPHCPRHLRTKGGRKQHIRAKHYFQGPEPHEPLPSLLRQSSSSESYHEPTPGPIPSDSTPSPSPSRKGSTEANTDYTLDVDHPMFDLDHTLPGSYVEEIDPDHVHAPDPPCVTCIYHPKLNGKSFHIIFLLYIL
jgi:hypothetical protein